MHSKDPDFWFVARKSHATLGVDEQIKVFLQLDRYVMLEMLMRN